MAEKRSGPFAFRPSTVNQKRLDFAANLELNCSELVNEVLEQHLQAAIQKAMKDKANRLQKALNAPVP